jgi:hypothetical protein
MLKGWRDGRPAAHHHPAWTLKIAFRRDDGGEGVPGLAAAAPDINGAVRGWSEG